MKHLRILPAVLLSISLATFSVSQAQIYLYHFQETIDIFRDVANYTLERTSDGGYIVAESYSDYNVPDNPFGIALVKLDPNLMTEWTMLYWVPDTLWREIIVRDIIQSESDELLICGSIKHFFLPVSHAFIARFEPNGNLIWFKVYPPNNSFNAIVDRLGGLGFLTCGNGTMNLYLNDINATVLAIDPDGIPDWSFYTPSQDSVSYSSYEDLIISGEEATATGNINYYPSISAPEHSSVLLTRFCVNGSVDFNLVYNPFQDSLMKKSLVSKALVHQGDNLFITGSVMADSIIVDSLYPDSVIWQAPVFRDVLVMSADYQTGGLHWHNRYNTGEQNLHDLYWNDEWGEKVLADYEKVMVCGHGISYHGMPCSREGFYLPIRWDGNPFEHIHFGDTLDDYLYDMTFENNTVVMAGYSTSFNPNNSELYMIEKYQQVKSICKNFIHQTFDTSFAVTIDTALSYTFHTVDTLLAIESQLFDPQQNIICEKKIAKPSCRLAERKDHQHYTVYPNPAHDHILVTGIGEPVKIRMFSMQGVLVVQGFLDADGYLGLHGTSPGIYLLTVNSTDHSQETFLIIIQ